MELNAKTIKKALECCSSSDGVSACESGCPYWGGDYDTCPCIEEPNFIIKKALALITSQEQRIKELTEENERLRAEWISVKDKLPKWNGLYLTFQDGKINISNFDAQKHKFGVWWHYTPDGRYEKNYRFIEADGITHWMPVEAPKGARDEEG